MAGQSLSEERRRNVEAWNESARYWEQHAATIRAMFEPLSAALIKAAALEPAKAEQSVLDVAGGTGEPALRIAEICGPRTSVTCTDVVRAAQDFATLPAWRSPVARGQNDAYPTSP